MQFEKKIYIWRDIFFYYIDYKGTKNQLRDQDTLDTPKEIF